MKRIRRIRIVSLLLLCAALAGMLQPATAESDVKLKTVPLLKNIYGVVPVNGTNLLITQVEEKSKWGLHDTDGNVLIPAEYESLSYLAYNYLNADAYPNTTYNKHMPIPQEQLNSHALVSIDGKVLTKYAYGNLVAFSSLWCAGWVLEQSTEEDYDYTPDKEHFLKIERCDIFYRVDTQSGKSGEPYLRLIASLSRDEYQGALAHGDYLSVQDRKNAITVYDQFGKQADIGATTLQSSPYGIKNWALLNLATGEMLMDGCSSVKEVQLTDETVLIAARTDFQGLKWNALLSTKGEVIIPMWNVTISNVYKDYAIMTSNVNGKKGLYSRVEKQLILPCVYDKIYDNSTALDPFDCNGYICVVKDEENYLYETASKKLLPAAKLAEDDEAVLSRYGATFYSTVTKGKVTTTRFFSPDGVETLKYCSIKKSRGSGYLLVANFSGSYNAVNWYGKSMIPYDYSDVSLTDDDRIIVKKKVSGYDVYKVVEEVVEEAVSDSL